LLTERITAFTVICDLPPNQKQRQSIGTAGHCRRSLHRQQVRLRSTSLSCQFRSEASSPDIERTNEPLPNFLASDGQNRIHPRPREWPWLAGDGCASCPLAATAIHKLSSPASHSSRTKKLRVLPSSTALRPFRCSSASPCLKPAIEAANERGFDQHEGN
jgi:hypothetical protein